MKIKTLSLNELRTHFITTFPGNADIEFSYRNIDMDIFDLILKNHGSIRILSSNRTSSYGGRRHNFYIIVTAENFKIKDIAEYEGDVQNNRYKEYFLAKKSSRNHRPSGR